MQPILDHTQESLLRLPSVYPRTLRERMTPLSNLFPGGSSLNIFLPVNRSLIHSFSFNTTCHNLFVFRTHIHRLSEVSSIFPTTRQEPSSRKKPYHCSTFCPAHHSTFPIAFTLSTIGWLSFVSRLLSPIALLSTPLVSQTSKIQSLSA